MSRFPQVDHIEAVVRAWPRLFAQAPVGMQPLTIDDSTLIVLCQAPHLLSHVERNEEHLVRGLNDALENRMQITAIRAASATATEIYLARELLALKIWLRDFDVLKHRPRHGLPACSCSPATRLSGSWPTPEARRSSRDPRRKTPALGDPLLGEWCTPVERLARATGGAENLAVSYSA